MELDRIKYAANLLDSATEEDWAKFIATVGGESAIHLLAAVEKARPAIERHQRALAESL